MSLPQAPERPANGAVPLSELHPGTTGVIERVEGDPQVSQRLLDLGFIPGTPVAMVRRAPLGDPVVYELRGYRIALRRNEGHQVQVRIA